MGKGTNKNNHSQ